ncbi:NAD(P)/FAD-dependent oxidoreductase [Devosia nitrariae]|uniref:NADH:ubiquinone reductase (non-electrogenic) n=1 Tax=Devosia nitrariae TaxID=2071872 RepID=A0ABQ5W5E4_9HYPH|nr:NAD(P)/FAD-dependent oxidoreductase [Devosia nitrariae]GLQ55083.1 NADH dehydrogenase [Devosia nitrariae]
MTTGKHRVVIIGGGFGGLAAALALKGADAEITIVDRRNHHLFQPLLYQVATAALATSEIAWPIRTILRDRREVRTVLGTVIGIDTGERLVRIEDGTALPYDSLILATGARHAYFGHDEWEANAPGLKTLEDATTIRRQLLEAFEAAERETDPQARAALLTFVVIGGGPTGVEMAGAISELARASLRDEFRTIDPREARVYLIEGLDRVLLAFEKDLSAYAEKALIDLGVIVELGRNVTQVDAEGVTYGDRRLAAKTVIWAAGVQASPAAKWLGAEADKAGRIRVEPDLTVPGHPEIFAVGDTATITMPDGKPVPGIANAAKQAGEHAARIIRARVMGDTAPKPFAYKHRGSLATIGKRAAVIDFGWIKLKGWIAWWVWGLAHIYFLIDAKNRFSVALSWLWIYLTGRRSARLITQGPAEKTAPLKEVTKTEG